MKIQIEVSEENEGTSEPWWILIDPRQIQCMMNGINECGEVPSAERILSAIAFAVTGPFFSRKDGEDYLKSRNYDYSDDAGVWCSSGYYSGQYKRALRDARQPETKKQQGE